MKKGKFETSKYVAGEQPFAVRGEDGLYDYQRAAKEHLTVGGAAVFDHGVTIRNPLHTVDYKQTEQRISRMHRPETPDPIFVEFSSMLKLTPESLDKTKMDVVHFMKIDGELTQIIEPVTDETLKQAISKKKAE